MSLDDIHLSDPFDPTADLSQLVDPYQTYTVRKYAFLGVNWYGIQLRDPPAFKDLPSSVSPDATRRILIVKDDTPSYIYSEAAFTTPPATNQFRADYNNVNPADASLIANMRSTGLIQFNPTEENQIVRVNYWRTGPGVHDEGLRQILNGLIVSGSMYATGFFHPGFPNWQVFTASGNWTVPANITKAFVTVIGGGGGGGGGIGTGFADAGDVWYGGGGGGGGGRALKIVTPLTPGDVITITVGAGGTAGSATLDNAGNGGSSSFGVHVSATGGAKGRGNATNIGGDSGVGVDGDINDRLGDGAPGDVFPKSADTHDGGAHGGMGGGPGGQAGRGYGLADAGHIGAGYGGGGGGGGANANAVAAGGAGKSGLVIVRW